MKAKLYAVVAALILATGCGASGPDGPRSGGASGPLSAAEESSLLFAREEEKVARDVYLAHGDLGAPFTSIAESE